MYRQLGKLPGTTTHGLRPLDIMQTRALMAEVGKGTHFSQDWVAAVREKTAGMPLYIEKVRYEIWQVTLHKACCCICPCPCYHVISWGSAHLRFL